MQGDEEAIASLYALYRQSMIALIHRRLGHTLHGLMESVDLVQSVWKDVLDDLPRFEDRGPDSLKRWLHTCLLHKIYAKKRFHDAGKRDAGRVSPLPPSDLGLASTDPTPSQDASAHEDLERVLTALRRLPPEQHEIMLLRMRDELTHEQVGQRVGKSTEAVKKMYRRGLERLIDMLPAEWNTNGDGPFAR